eukprot:gene3260-3741_t
MRQLVNHVSTDYAAFAVTGFVLLIVTLLYLFWLDRKKNQLSFPGLVPTDPDLGNLVDIKKAGSLHEFLVDLHNKLGPVASFWWGKELAVSLGSPIPWKDVVTLFNRPVAQFAMFMPLIGENSIQYANGADGRKKRQILDRSFSHAAMSGYAPVFNEVADEMVKKWGTLAKGEHIPLRQYMLAGALKSLMCSSFGKFFNSAKQILEFEEAYDACWSEMEYRLAHGMPEPGSEREKKFETAKNFLLNKTKEVIKHRRSQKDKDGHIFLDVILEDKDAFPTEEAICDMAITYVIGGFHTTGTLLTWAVYYLSLHPECQEKILTEINNTIKDNPVSMENIADLKYMRQVIDEALRASVLAPWAARYSDYDIIVSGHVIPKETPIILPLGVVLQDPEIWPEPTRFDPDRFSPENVKTRDKLAFSPFGFAGKRKCPGYRFFYLEATAMLVALIRKFKLNLVEGCRAEKEFNLVTQPKEEIWITVQKRD